MPQPHLDLGDIGVMLQCIGCGRGTQTMHTQPVDLDACSLSPLRNHLIDAIGADPGTGGATADRAKQGAIARFAGDVPFQIRMNALGRDRVLW